MLGWSGGDSTVRTCHPGMLPHESPPKGIRETQKKPFFPSVLSETSGLFQISCQVSTQRKGPLLSAILARPDPAYGAGPPSTHLPVDKAVQRDPRGPHIQGLEREQLPSAPPKRINTPGLQVPVGCGRGHAGHLLPRSCVRSAHTPRPGLHARLCAEPWDTGVTRTGPLPFRDSNFLWNRPKLDTLSTQQAQTSFTHRSHVLYPSHRCGRKRWCTYTC